MRDRDSHSRERDGLPPSHTPPSLNLANGSVGSREKDGLLHAPPSLNLANVRVGYIICRNCEVWVHVYKSEASDSDTL